MKTGFKKLAMLLAVAMLCGSIVYPATASEDVTTSADETVREEGTTEDETTTSQKYGDGTGDGVVNASDALMVLEIAAGIKVIDDAMRSFLDVNGDGVINASDALNVLEYSANIIVKFPVEELLPEPTKEPEITKEPKPTKEPEITEEPKPTYEPDLSMIPDGAQRFGNSYYYIQIHGELTWEGAEEACEAMGGHLATITSAEEQRFIEELNAYGDSLWIGGFRSYDGEWRWITGEVWEYNNWGEGEPNNSSNVVSNERYVTVWHYEWNDLANKNIYEQCGYICEWDAYDVVVRPEPDVSTEPTVTPEPGQRPAYIPENAQKSGNSYYLIVDAYEILWEDAKTACEEMKGHLACITSQEEQEYIDALNEWDADLWLGGYKNMKGSWNWVTDEAWDYTNWIVTDSWDFDGDLVVRTMGPGWYYLHKQQTTGIDGYICEWEVETNTDADIGTDVDSDVDTDLKYEVTSETTAN